MLFKVTSVFSYRLKDSLASFADIIGKLKVSNILYREDTHNQFINLLGDKWAIRLQGDTVRPLYPKRLGKSAFKSTDKVNSTKLVNKIRQFLDYSDKIKNSKEAKALTALFNWLTDFDQREAEIAHKANIIPKEYAFSGTAYRGLHLTNKEYEDFLKNGLVTSQYSSWTPAISWAKKFARGLTSAERKDIGIVVKIHLDKESNIGNIGKFAKDISNIADVLSNMNYGGSIDEILVIKKIKLTSKDVVEEVR